MRIKQKKKSVQCTAVVADLCVCVFGRAGEGGVYFILFFDPFLPPHRWIIASEGRRGGPQRATFSPRQGLIKPPPAISGPPRHQHDPHPSPPPPPSRILPAPAVQKKNPPADSRPVIRFHGNLGRPLGRLSEVGLRYPSLSLPHVKVTHVEMSARACVCVFCAVMSSQGLNEDRWLSVPGLCPLQSTVRERDIGNRHLGYINPMVHLARQAKSRRCFSLSIWGKIHTAVLFV